MTNLQLIRVNVQSEKLKRFSDLSAQIQWQVIANAKTCFESFGIHLPFLVLEELFKNVNPKFYGSKIDGSSRIVLQQNIYAELMSRVCNGLNRVKIQSSRKDTQQLQLLKQAQNILPIQ